MLYATHDILGFLVCVGTLDMCLAYASRRTQRMVDYTSDTAQRETWGHSSTAPLTRVDELDLIERRY